MSYSLEVDLHTHTLASDHAFSTVHDYVRAAPGKGIRLFAITDHGPAMEDSPHIWHFQNSQTWPRVDNGVGILRGIESNVIDVDGSIDIPDSLVARLDIVLCGFHKPAFAPRSKEENTQALVNVIGSGLVDVITHPGNNAFPIDFEAVVLAAAKHNVALEVNNSSFLYSRKGSEESCGEIVRLAKELGAPVSVGSDAHSAWDLGRFDKSIELLEAHDFPSEKIINRTPESLFAFLASRGKDIASEFEL